MSFLLNWDLLKDKEEANKLKDFVNEKFQQIQRPNFLGSITVVDFDFGDIPPEVVIEDLCDPLPEFYLKEDSDYINENSSNAGSSQTYHNVLASPTTPQSRQLEHTAGSAVEYPGFVMDIHDDPMFLREAKHDTDAQLDLSIKYHGNMRLAISTELIVNQPTPAFMVLPLTLILTGFSFEATAMIAYLGNAIHFCLKEPEENQYILQNINIESEIGDKNKQVLKNVGKIEKFIVQQIVEFFNDFLVFPNYHTILLVQDDEYEQME